MLVLIFVKWWMSNLRPTAFLTLTVPILTMLYNFFLPLSTWVISVKGHDPQEGYPHCSCQPQTYGFPGYLHVWLTGCKIQDDHNLLQFKKFTRKTDKIQESVAVIPSIIMKDITHEQLSKESLRIRSRKVLNADLW